MTSTTWTPPPTMPADLPPLPIGRNGKKMVYVGTDEKHNKTCHHTWGRYMVWNTPEYHAHEKDSHYAAESDSEICRLNQWGDFTPAQPSEPCKDAQPPTLAAYLASIESYIKEAEEAMQKATELAAAWAKELQARRNIRERLQGAGDDALSRQKWMEHGMKIQRLHLKRPTVFPKYP